MIDKLKKIIKHPYKVSISGILLCLLLVGASYAFFSSDNTELSDSSLTFGNGLNISYILEAKTDLSFDINPLYLTEGGKEYTESPVPAQASVLLGNNSEHPSVKCTYEIWYTPTKVFNNSSANTTGLMEMAIVGSDSSNQNTGFIYDINGVSNPVKLSDGVISVLGETADVTQNWTFSIRHYNLATSQDDNVGKTFGGTIEFKPIGCEKGEASNITLASYLKNTVYNNKVNQNNINEGKAGLYYHNGTILSDDGTTILDAADESYRYAGADESVNNYVCFLGDDCTQEDNLYRIISVDSNNVTKIIKATRLDGMEWDDGLDSSRNVVPEKAYTATGTSEDIAMGLTSGTSYANIWGINQGQTTEYKSTLNEYLNGTYLTGLGDKADLIEITTWHVGGATSTQKNKSNPKTFMELELDTAASDDTNKGIYEAKVGLVYVYEHGFAALPTYWATNLDSYNASKENNWLVTSRYLWTISRQSNSMYYAFYLDYNYTSVLGSIVTGKNVVRPVLGLSSRVKITNASFTNIGSKSNPIIIK